MLAVWLEEERLSLRDDLDCPVPSPDEALIRVLTAGICNTDLELARGYYPFTGIPGHEFVGTVVEGPEELRGQRVVGEINIVCHECPTCRRGRPSHCEKRRVLGIRGHHGAFAEYLTLPTENLHPVPDHVSNDMAVFVEPLAAALQIQQQIAIGPDSRVLVVGDGKLGQLITRVLALTGCHLTVIGRHPAKLQLLAAIATTTTEPEALPQRGFDIAVDCTGNPSGFDLARRGLRPRGALVLKSTYADRLDLDASALVVDEITVIGSRCGPFAPALDLLSERRIDLETVVETRYPLSEALAAVEHARRRGSLKVLIEPATREFAS